MANPRDFDEALAALSAELAGIAEWSGAPQYAYMREMQAKGQLYLDYQGLEKKLKDFRLVLPAGKQAEFDACVQHIAKAFGQVIIHAAFPYDSQLDVMRGWPEAWQSLDDALKGINLFLAILGSEESGRHRSGGSGGPRADLFNVDRGVDRGCA